MAVGKEKYNNNTCSYRNLYENIRGLVLRAMTIDIINKTDSSNGVNDIKLIVLLGDHEVSENHCWQYLSIHRHENTSIVLLTPNY